MKQYAEVIACGNERPPLNWYFPPQLICLTTPPTIQNCIKSRKKLRRKKLEISVMHVMRGPTILGVTDRGPCSPWSEKGLLLLHISRLQLRLSLIGLKE